VIAHASEAIGKLCRIEQYLHPSLRGLRRRLPRDRRTRTVMIAGVRDFFRIDRYGAAYLLVVQ